MKENKNKTLDRCPHCNEPISAASMLVAKRKPLSSEYMTKLAKLSAEKRRLRMKTKSVDNPLADVSAKE